MRLAQAAGRQLQLLEQLFAVLADEYDPQRAAREPLGRGPAQAVRVGALAQQLGVAGDLGQQPVQVRRPSASSAGAPARRQSVATTPPRVVPAESTRWPWAPSEPMTLTAA
ncbi:hypothetical protein ACGF3G_35535 [Streptomyces sp. NPDC048179]|uniref:hypothetical protein n=1 Tax=Streptomyces sp. NPDC048179 TaxID=3365506 RepID=UPI0037243269